MRYVVIGAGAVGGVVGGLLADAGRDVVLVARGDHGSAIRSSGLQVWLPDRDLRPPADVVGSLEELELRPEDVLCLAVKSHQMSAVLGDLSAQDVAGEPASVLPLFCFQNGIFNEDAALREAPDVHGVCVNLAATHLEPGVVQAEGFPVRRVFELGRAVGGHDAVDEAVAHDLEAAGLIADVRDDVMAWKRAKLLRNLANAGEALFGTVADPDEQWAAKRIRAAALAEGRAVFAAAGLTIVDDSMWRTRLEGRTAVADVHGRPRPGGSTWQSVQRDRDVETPYLNGEIVRLGRWLGVATPANEALQAAMRRLVRDAAPTGSVRPSALAAALPD